MENYSQRFLVVIEGPHEGQTYPLQDMVCTLGRTADNTIVIDSARISRHHTQIRLLPEGAIVEDMGSTNGTWVNQRPLTGPRRLMPGDIITLADYISFRYTVEDAMRTEKLTLDATTQVMDDNQTYAPPPPPPSDYEKPYQAYTVSDMASQYSAPQRQPFVQLGPASQSPATPPSPPAPPPSAPPAKRSKWVYIVAAILLVLICICVAVAVYLWFAPAEFWEQVFEFFNIPIP